MHHPYAEHVGLSVTEQAAGRSTCVLAVRPEHFNPHGVVHGAVLYALADTGMGAALYPTLAAGESCATIQVTMSYFRPVTNGTLRCATELLHRGRTVAHLESRIYAGETLVAAASGNYAILAPRSSP
jgi:acyl-CoA thioesterase